MSSCFNKMTRRAYIQHTLRRGKPEWVLNADRTPEAPRNQFFLTLPSYAALLSLALFLV